MPDLYVVCVGNPADGFTLHGPYHDAEIAGDVATLVFRNENWWILKVESAPGADR